MKNRDIIHYAFINLKKRLMSSIFIGLSVVVLSFFCFVCFNFSG